MTSDIKMLGMTIKPPVILSLALVDGLPKNLNKVILMRFLALLGMTIEKRNDNKSRNNKKKKEKQYQRMATDVKMLGMTIETKKNKNNELQQT